MMLLGRQAALSEVRSEFATGESVGTIDQTGGGAITRLLPDGRTAMFADLDGKVFGWNLRPNTWVAAACRIAGRDLTRSEWRAAFGDREFRRTCSQQGLTYPNNGWFGWPRRAKQSHAHLDALGADGTPIPAPNRGGSSPLIGHASGLRTILLNHPITTESGQTGWGSPRPAGRWRPQLHFDILGNRWPRTLSGRTLGWTWSLEVWGT